VCSIDEEVCSSGGRDGACADVHVAWPASGPAPAAASASRRAHSGAGVRLQNVQPHVPVVPGAGRAPCQPQEAAAGRGRWRPLARQAQAPRLLHLWPRVRHRAGARRPHEAPPRHDRRHAAGYRRRQEARRRQHPRRQRQAGAVARPEPPAVRGRLRRRGGVRPQCRLRRDHVPSVPGYGHHGRGLPWLLAKQAHQCKMLLSASTISAGGGTLFFSYINLHFHFFFFCGEIHVL
jgi:hypothetical protein